MILTDTQHLRKFTEFTVAWSIDIDFRETRFHSLQREIEISWCKNYVYLETKKKQETAL